LRFLLTILSSLLLLTMIGGAGVLYVLHHFGRDLPEFAQLADYEPPIVSRVHARDGRLLAEFATENRVFVPIEAIPRRVTKAFIAAEDQNFYRHNGVDLKAVARAALTNVKLYIQGRRPVGASTITQQVAKNFLLTNELSYKRKVKEAILALRIEQALEKVDRRGGLPCRTSQGTKQLPSDTPPRGGDLPARLGHQPHAEGGFHHSGGGFGRLGGAFGSPPERRGEAGPGRVLRGGGSPRAGGTLRRAGAL
jgi:hypothetical protein